MPFWTKGIAGKRRLPNRNCQRYLGLRLTATPDVKCQGCIEPFPEPSVSVHEHEHVHEYEDVHEYEYEYEA